MSQRLFSGPAWALNISNTLVLTLGLLVSARLQSGHAIQRTGAIIAAVTGLFVIWQIWEEIRAEAALHRHAEPDAEISGRPLDELTVIERTERQLRESKQHRREQGLTRARLILVCVIALWLSLGEVMHGFGDLLWAMVAAGSGSGGSH